MVIDLRIANELKRRGFEMPEITKALRAADADGRAVIGGYTIRPGVSGDLILLHPSWGGIYVGDYKSHIHFQKNLCYTYSGYGFMNAKHGELAQVLEKLDKAKTNRIHPL